MFMIFQSKSSWAERKNWSARCRLELFVKLHNSKINNLGQTLTIIFTTKDLAQLNERQDLPVDLEPYVKKLIGSRRRITLVNNILHNAQVNIL